MAVPFSDNLGYLGPLPNFTRDAYATIADMKAQKAVRLPPVFLAVCYEDRNFYKFDVNNTEDPITGKWRLYSGATIQVESLPEASATFSGKILQFVGITDTYINGYFYQCIESSTPGTYEWVSKSVQAGGGGSADLQAALTASVAVGGVKVGDNWSQGTPLETVIRDVLDPVQYPTLTNPSASLSASPTGTLIEVGGTKTVTFTATFNRGTINPAYGTSGYRAGPATDYSLNGGEAQAGNSWSNIIVANDNKTFQATVNYSAGEQPKDSKGNNYSSPLAAGSVNTSTITYEFVNALWANTSNIATVAKLALVSKSTKLKEFNFPAATVANPEIFEVPASWTITAVEYYDEVFTHAWSDCSSEFTITDTIEKDAANVDTAYKRYTCNLGVSMGARKIRIKWS